jgi:hypothetical protein
VVVVLLLLLLFSRVIYVVTSCDGSFRCAAAADRARVDVCRTHRRAAGDADATAWWKRAAISRPRATSSACGADSRRRAGARVGSVGCVRVCVVFVCVCGHCGRCVCTFFCAVGTPLCCRLEPQWRRARVERAANEPRSSWRRRRPLERVAGLVAVVAVESRGGGGQCEPAGPATVPAAVHRRRSDTPHVPLDAQRRRCRCT